MIVVVGLSHRTAPIAIREKLVFDAEGLPDFLRGDLWAAIASLLAGKAPETPRLTGACYNTVAPGYAFSLSGVYAPKDGMFAEVEVATSPLDAPREERAREADTAQSWYRNITVESFG